MFIMYIKKNGEVDASFWETLHNHFVCPYTMKPVYWGSHKDGVWYSNTIKEGRKGMFDSFN